MSTTSIGGSPSSSGSSLLTLGIARPDGIESTLLVFSEAVIGLFLLALLQEALLLLGSFAAASQDG